MKHKHEGIYSIDYYAYVSGLRKWNPTYKVLLSFLTLVICVAADHLHVSLLIMVTMSALTIFVGRMEVHSYLSLLTVPFAFMVMGSLAIAVGISAWPTGQYRLSFHWFYLYVSQESLWKTFCVMMKALGAVTAMYMMVLSTPASEIISVLRRFHIPKLVIELMNMIYRFIFILMDVQVRMKNSAQSRLGYCDFKTSCYSFGHTAGNLLIVSLKKANIYYDAMISRCYDGDLVFLEEEKKVKAGQIAGAAGYLLMLLLVYLAARGEV